MKCNFVIGQKVVCVNDTPNSEWKGPFLIEKGKTYTIREILVTPHNSITLKFKEIPSREGMPGYPKDHIDHGYRFERFRPLKNTNIDIFTSMLNRTPQRS